MPKPKYEIDSSRSYENGHHEIIAILTGMPIGDIERVSSPKLAWCARDYIQAFRRLGFNCNSRFIKWDPETKYPAMMRYRRTDRKEPYWHTVAYYDGKVYLGNGEWWRLEAFLAGDPVKVTSMLQVWM